jgi:hypothetical protein
MEESATYRAIVHRARVEEARSLVLLVGEKKFGPADDAVRAVIENMADLDKLEQLGVCLMTTESWQELLPAQAPPRRTRRRKVSE